MTDVAWQARDYSSSTWSHLLWRVHIFAWIGLFLPILSLSLGLYATWLSDFRVCSFLDNISVTLNMKFHQILHNWSVSNYKWPCIKALTLSLMVHHYQLPISISKHKCYQEINNYKICNSTLSFQWTLSFPIFFY